jgi:prolyl 4-hydroxylase
MRIASLFILLGVLFQLLGCFYSDDSCARDGGATGTGTQKVCDSSQHVKLHENVDKMLVDRKENMTTDCQDQDPHCTDYASAGECTNNFPWMVAKCPFSCDMCHLRDYSTRCNRTFLNISSEPVYHPGDINFVFSTLPQRMGARFQMHVLSRDPWIVTFENFLSEEQINALLSVAEREGSLGQSLDIGEMDAFGFAAGVSSQDRTSSNTWCKEDCRSNPLVQQVVRQIQQVVYIPPKNYEPFQILRYGVGERYNRHHDTGP